MDRVCVQYVYTIVKYYALHVEFKRTAFNIQLIIKLM